MKKRINPLFCTIMEYLQLGTIIDSFGLEGGLKVYSTTNNQEARYQEGNEVFLYDKNFNTHSKYLVKKFRRNGKLDIVFLEGITNKDDADKLKGYEIHVIKDRNELEEGYFFYADLRGCEIYDEENNLLGKVKEVEEFPAQITLRVKSLKGKDFFVPFIEAFIKNVDVESKKIIIHFMEGML